MSNNGKPARRVDTFDEAYDVNVVGYGYAGAISALEATKAGARERAVVPSIYSIWPPNGGLALRHGHHFEPAGFEIGHGRGLHDAHFAGSCQGTLCKGMRMPAASTLPQREIDRSPAEIR